MENGLTIDELVARSRLAFSSVTEACHLIPEDRFFSNPSSKWSVAQHLEHLIISTKVSTAPFALPRFIIRLVGGKPKRASVGYDELVERYQQQLKAGGKATGRYIPKNISSTVGKQAIINRWENVTSNYLLALKNNRKDTELDLYFVPHPLLGKITLRELSYFTIYHTYHHMVSFRNL